MQLQDKDKHKNNCCKICCKPVKKKDGIQCQGMCKKWAHYKCLCYTPGKIADIKSGALKILCPCPDCGSEPKEILDDKFKNCNENANISATNQCECLQNKNDSTREDTFMWRKSRFPPFGAPYGYEMQMGTNEIPGHKTQAVRLQSWSLIDIQNPNSNPMLQKTYQSNVNTPASPFKSQSSTTVQTSNANFSYNSAVGSPGMLDTLEQMCTTVTFLAEQILQIKNKLASVNSTTVCSKE